MVPLTLAAASAANTLTFAGDSPTLDITGLTRFTGLLAGSATITKTGPGTANTRITANIVKGEDVRWTGASSGDWDVGSGVNVGGTQNWLTETSLNRRRL